MSENIIISLITLIGSVGSSALLINWRLKILEKKVEEHNGYAKMFSEHTTEIKLMAKDISYIKEKLG